MIGGWIRCVSFDVQRSGNALYAYGAVVASGVRLVFLAGACPFEQDETTVSVGDYVGQSAKCIQNLTEALRLAGAPLQDVVSTRVLVASAERSDLGAVWDIVHNAFADHDVPSTVLGFTVLGYEDQLVGSKRLPRSPDEEIEPSSALIYAVLL